MNDDRQLLAPVDPETWIDRFVAGATDADVAFVTPSGHVLTWAQYRFAYPRYREVDEDWRPPTNSLDTIVLHFGAYEVAIPAAQLDGELSELSDYVSTYQRLKEEWQRAHPESTLELPMDAEIMLERTAAVHAKFEVTAATFAHDREPLQDLLSVPGVRIERSHARLSEVAYALTDGVPSPGVVDRETRDARARFLLSTSRAAARAAEADGTALTPDPMAARQRVHRSVARISKLDAIFGAVSTEYGDDAETFQLMMFIEAVREQSTTRQLLRLAHAFVAPEQEPSSSNNTLDASSWDWVWLAQRLQQHRTAWCLAIRAFDGQWRRGRSHHAPYGSNSSAYVTARSTHLGTLADLAQQSGHPYWSTVFATWKADYDAGRAAEPAISPVSADDERSLDDARLAHLRAARPSFRDGAE